MEIQRQIIQSEVFCGYIFLQDTNLQAQKEEGSPNSHIDLLVRKSALGANMTETDAQPNLNRYDLITKVNIADRIDRIEEKPCYPFSLSLLCSRTSEKKLNILAASRCLICNFFLQNHKTTFTFYLTSQCMPN